ncbi:MAG TPA: dihydrolipoamide acetyltransferase family protein [Streptosporangiaceae bacterium]|nr:dihydrolipoamide acetyltransferase family protein [Streptosporangiaceae bacterium]
MPDFLLPDLGEGLTEAEIIAWRVQVGDHVDVDQPVVEVETAKAAVEVPVPFAGAVAKIHAAPGTVVVVGQPLISISADETASGNVLIGYGTAEPSRKGSRAARRSRRAARPLPGGAPASPPPPDRPGPVAVISPLVRKIARDAGLDLTSVAGTGPSGLVRRDDVRKALTQKKEHAAPRPAAVAPGPAEPGEKRIPLRGARRAAADNLSRSRREIPEATVWVDVDATGLLEARSALNGNATRQPVSILALVARFAVLGLRRYPELGARVDEDEIVVPGHVHLGFAAQTEHGLLVPVVHDAHRMTTRELSAALAARTAAARDGSLTPADLTGGTFTVNNYGVFGVDGSAAIINHPEVAILGLGRIIDRPWVVGGQVLVRKMGELTLAFDHRVCDGATAGGFLRYVADCIESPVGAIGDL